MTKRANPSNSTESARRHFFRHFHDVKELRRNPLATPFFDSAYAQHRPAPDHAALLNLHRAIRKIVDDYERSTMGEPESEPLRRQLALFKAYVFDQRPWEQLAVELGLSRRQFFRDYAAVRDRILNSFLPLRISASAGEWLEPDEAPILQATLLAEADLLNEASAALRHVVAESSRPQTRARALCALARLNLEQTRYLEAQYLAEAARLECNEPEIRARVLVLNELLKWRSLGTAAVRDLEDAATSQVLRCDRNNATIPLLYIEFLVNSAERLAWVGELDRALTVIQRAKALLDAHPGVAVAQRISLIQVYADILSNLSSENLPEGIAMVSEAEELARRNGHLRSALIAAAASGQFYFLAGQHDTSLAIFNNCLSVCERVNDRALLAKMHVDMVSDANWRPRWTVEHLEIARPLLPAHDYRIPPLYLGLLIAYGLLDEMDTAFHYAENALRMARSTDNLRVSGAIMREIAMLQFKCGQTERARESIREAVAILERHGNAYSLARGYRSYAAITGDERYSHKLARL